MIDWLTTTLAGVTVLIVGWSALRLVRNVDSLHAKTDENSGKLARIEGRLGDGIAKELSKIGPLEAEVHGVRDDLRSFVIEFKDHADNEEERILGIWHAQEEKT